MYKTIREEISNSIKSSDCKAVKENVDLLKKVFPKAWEYNVRTALDSRAPGQKNTWAYAVVDKCNLKNILDSELREM